MKKFTLTTLLFLILMAGYSQTKNFIDQPYIEVSGSADTLVAPDEIYIKITISEKDTRDRTSVEEMERKMVDVLKSLGIDTEKDLEISDMLSNFRFYLLKNKDVLKTKQYILKVRDAVTASKVFAQLEQTGISNTSIDRVDYSALKNIKRRMLSKAVIDAKTKATALVSPLNQVVGPAIQITDNSNRNPGLIQGRVAGISVLAYNVSSAKKELPKIEFEKIKVIANIQVKFILQ